MSVCFVVGAFVKTLQVTAFTLAWTHSVELTDWQEDWQVTGDGLILTEARIKGSGAGIDPPADARLIGGWWRWTPVPLKRAEISLAQSGAVADWRICLSGGCTPLAAAVGVEAAGRPVVVRPCAK